VKVFGWMLTLGMLGAGLQVGCRDNTPPPPNVPVPSADDPNARRERDPIKPLPQQSTAGRTTQSQ